MRRRRGAGVDIVVGMTATKALVGYDGSDEAGHAIACAAALLPDAEAMVATVWHAVWPSGDVVQDILHEREGVTVDDLAARLKEIGEAGASATAAAGAACAEAAGWTAQGTTRESQQGVWFELAALAREADARAIVVGARGTGGASRLGRVADAIVRVADRPVLVVPHDAPRPSADAPLVIGFDGSPLAERAIRAAGALLPGRRAVVIHVGHLDLAADGVAIATESGLQAEALDVDAPLSDVVRPESAPWHQLDRVAGELDAAAIVVGARGGGALRRFLLGSTTSGLLHHAQRPLVVIPEASAGDGA